MRQIYYETLVLGLNCYCGDNLKNKLLSKHLLQGTQKCEGSKSSQGNDKFLQKKQCLPFITWNKKHLSNKVMSITYTLEKIKKFFAGATFEGS